MDNDAVRLMQKQHKTDFLVIAIVVAGVSPMAVRSDYHRVLLAISMIALCVNYYAGRWAFTPPTRVFADDRKFHIFKSVYNSSGVVTPYTALCVLLPRKSAFVVVPVIPFICLATTLYSFYPVQIKDGFKWAWSKITCNFQGLPTTTQQAQAQASGPAPAPAQAQAPEPAPSQQVV